MRNPKFSHAFEVVAELPKPLMTLKRLAMNFRWTWDHACRELFRSIDKELWDEANHNPIAFLSSIPRERLNRLAEDPAFLAKLRLCEEGLDAYMAADTWFDREFPGRRNEVSVAYFCAEFGLTEGLPIYSGGLGILAGDHLKAASDLGLPLVGVGLLYARGYFRQQLDHDGWQKEIYPEYDFYQMPLELMRGKDEQPLRIEVELPDRIVTCQVWRANIGRVPLYLLDSNVLENEATDQGITDTLYGGDQEMRIRQEIILGIGGLRALRAMGIEPTVCHMNEGHAAFMALERIRQFMIEQNCDFRTARQVIVSGNVFTTHTPVPAGFDLFDIDLLRPYMAKNIEACGLTFQQFVRMGRIDPENEGEAFNMALLAMGNADHVNGVAKLHAKVTRAMFHNRWPDLPEDEVPVEAITNGIHTATWTSRRMQDLLDEYLGSEWRHDSSDPAVWQKVFDIPDSDIWSVKENQRGDLVRYIRKRLQNDIERRSMSRPDFNIVGGVFDPRVLTIGFARRFATYKRATLMMTDKERLLQLLHHPERPIQIVIAGKSHPKDDGGKQLIKDLVHFINNEGARARMVFLEDYDMRVARQLVQGVDVWLNNPRRPLEASGTSGMKVVPNGGLNCSILDGWWDEGYSPGVGFAIGDRTDSDNSEHQDWLDSRSLYATLEQQIASKFYHRDEHGIPTQWIQMVKQSMAQLTPAFSTARMVSDYARKFYMPAADSYLKLRANNFERAKEALAWRDRVQATWKDVKIVEVHDSAGIKNPLGSTVRARAKVALGALQSEDVAVQAVVGNIGPNRELTHTEVCPLVHTGYEDGLHTYEGEIRCDSPGHHGYTVRVVPANADVSVRHELRLVRWEGK